MFGVFTVCVGMGMSNGVSDLFKFRTILNFILFHSFSI